MSNPNDPIDVLASTLAAEPVQLPRIEHYRLPSDRPFTADQRAGTTILFGGLTWKHERLIQAVLNGAGYRCKVLPTPDLDAFHLGKEYANNGQCSPAYFTIGSLIQYLRNLERSGRSRRDITDSHVLWTAGSCGPCRFGMYECEYRLALANAGYDGFRVLLFQQNLGIKQRAAASTNGDDGEAHGAVEPGLRYTLDMGMGILNAVNAGDVFHESIYKHRPFEVVAGEVDRVYQECVEHLAGVLEKHDPYDSVDSSPAWLAPHIAKRPALRSTLTTLGKVRRHLYGAAYVDALRECRARIDQIELDRTRVKPVVKVIGEFWVQTTEGAGNYSMFAFLEREGAHVSVEPLAAWVTYLLYQLGVRMSHRRAVAGTDEKGHWWEFRKRLQYELQYRKKWIPLRLGERIYIHQFERVLDLLGGSHERLVPQVELARLAEPFYNPMARGGEGHLEVGKNIYYTLHRRCHMVLSVKPFGCMPSLQSDGVQSAVVDRHKDMIFLPIEISGEGEVNAHSRVQMALSEAKLRARAEFERALASTGKRLDRIRDYVSDHRELRRPFYQLPRRPGIAGEAANFVLHVSDLMDRRNTVGSA